MINKDASLGSMELAVLTARAGNFICPIPGSPLEELVKATSSMVGIIPMDLENTGKPSEELLKYCDSLETVTVNSETDSVHSQLMDSYITTISKAVAGHISFAKNVVAPIITEVADSVIKHMGNDCSPSAEFSIDIVDLPKPMQNASFESSLEDYKGKSLITPFSEFRFGEISPQAILELMKSGSKEFDEKVNEWFASKGDLFFVDVWSNLFRDFKESKPSVIYNFIDGTTNFDSGIDVALAVYLITRKIKEEIPEDNKLELKQYKTLCFEYMNASAFKLVNEYNRYASVIKTKSLIIAFKPDGKGCKVNGAVYRQWLKEGGNNEIILGLIVGKRNLYSCNLINAEKQDLIKDWNNYFMFSKTTQKNKSFNRFKDALTIAFSDSIKEPKEEETAFIQSTPLYGERVKEYFNLELDKLITKDTTDIYNTCMNIICKARFYYTDSEKILRGINEAVAVNPNVDIREAALMSTTEYVIDYICDQLVLRSLTT